MSDRWVWLLWVSHSRVRAGREHLLAGTSLSPRILGSLRLRPGCGRFGGMPRVLPVRGTPWSSSWCQAWTRPR